VRDEVLSRAGRYREVEGNLWVKEVWVGDRRYIVCYNPEEAEKDAHDREALLQSLEERLKDNPKGLIGNRGYRRYLVVNGEAVTIDRKKVEEESRFDGKFVLRTNTRLSAEEVAIQYKRLWVVEQFFRLAKSLLETRPVFHRCDMTIRGHIFCSFLALLVRHELMGRIEAKGEKFEWQEILRDLKVLQHAEVRQGDRQYLLRMPLQRTCGKVLQAVGVAVPPPVKEL